MSTKEQYLIRGHGFISSKLQLRLPEATLLPRGWIEVPDFDNLYYLASYGNYYDQTDISEIYKANLSESIRLVLETERIPYHSFIFVSSSSVILPKQTFYSTSKKATEDFVKVYFEQTGKPIACIRPSSVTGVGEQSNHLIPRLIQSCLTGERIPFVAEPTHDFIDIEDFVTGMLCVSNNIKDYQGKVVNISSGRSVSNLEVLQMVEDITGKKANIEIVQNMRKYDTQEWIVEDSLPFLPKKPLETSIVEMVAEYETNKEAIN